jgi:hypothetical protein
MFLKQSFGKLLNYFMKLHVCVFSDSSLEWTVLATPCILNQWLRSKMCIHCKKRLGFFPSPAGMSLTKLSLAIYD